MSLASPLQARAALQELREAVRRHRRTQASWRPITPTAALESRLRKQLAQVLAASEQAILGAVGPMLADWPRREDAAPSPSSVEAAVRKASREVDRRVPLSLMGPEVQRIYLAADAEHQEAMRRQFSRAFGGVDILAAQPSLDAVIALSTRSSVQLIRSVPEQLLGQVADVLTDALKEGAQGPEVYKLLRERFSVARTRAEVITKDQMGKFYSAATAERHQQLGITRWRWRTMRDSRVRPEHVALEGKVFEYGNDPSEGLPGTAVLCRCFQEPLVQDLL